jgi:dihydrofolate reductase
MSLDGFVAGPDHDMGWMTGFTVADGVIDAYIAGAGAVLSGRDGFDGAIGDSRPWGGRWKGPIFVLTHQPEDARPEADITFLSCPVEQAVQIGLDAAAGRDLYIFSPTIGAQLLDLGLINEIDIHVLPVLLGQGIRLYDHPGHPPVRLHRVDIDDPTAAARVRYVPERRAGKKSPARGTPTGFDRLGYSSVPARTSAIGGSSSRLARTARKSRRWSTTSRMNTVSSRSS